LAKNCIFWFKKITAGQSIMNWEGFIQRLYADGFLKTPQMQDTARLPESGYGRWLSIAGAWLSAWLLVGFIGALGNRLLESNLFCAAAGIVLLVGGLGVGRTVEVQTRVMLGQLALIACVLGGLLLSKALLQLGWENYALLALAGLFILCLLIASEQGQRRLFAVAGVGFLCAFFVRHHWSIVAWAICLMAVVTLCLKQDQWVIRGRGELLNALMPALSLGTLSAPLLLSKHSQVNHLVAEVAASSSTRSFLASDLTWASLGAISALVVAAVGYRTGLRPLRRFALAAILGYGYTFYFALGTNLLHKAFALFSTGVVLLLLRLWVSRKTQGSEASQ
jgi:hypothetical protein